MFTPEKIKEIRDSVGDDGYTRVSGYLVLECLDEIQRLRNALMKIKKADIHYASEMAAEALGEKK